MILADSSLAAFLRMLADNPDPDTVAASIAQGVLSAFRPIVTALGFIHLDRQVLAVVGAFGRDPEVRHLYSAVPLDTDMPGHRLLPHERDRDHAVGTTGRGLPAGRAVRELRPGPTAR